MSVLQNPNPNVKKFMMPSTANKPEAEQDWIMIDVRPTTVGDSFVYTDQDNNENLRLARILLSRIQSWSFTDASGTMLPLNLDSMKLLNQVDFLFLSTISFSDAATPAPTLDSEEKKS